MNKEFFAGLKKFDEFEFDYRNVPANMLVEEKRKE